MLRKDRQSNKRGGGIAICFNTERVSFTKAKIPPSKHELYAAVGRRTGQRRKIVVFAIYIPPWYNAEQNKSLFKHTNDAILALKSKYEDPYIVVGGDFNRRDFKAATSEFPDIKAVDTEPTRGTAVLDILGSNMNELLIDKGTADPIQSEEGTPTDHNTVFCQFRMQRVPSYTVESYSYYHLTQEGHSKFGAWLNTVDWTEITNCREVDTAVDLLHKKFKNGMDESYKFITRRKKSSEPSWMSDWIRKDIGSRRRIFKSDKGRSDRWQLFKNKLSAKIKKRKRTYNEFIISKFDNEKNPGKFFSHLKTLLGHNDTSRWSPTDMYPGDSEQVVAEKLAEYYNDISSLYQPLDMSLLPKTYSRQLPVVSAADVEKKMKKSKKTSSTVPGDIPSVLFDLHADKLCRPVSFIFNLITMSFRLPTEWKVEYVTVIPKAKNPLHASECRNISCTNYLSKLYLSLIHI